MEKFQRELASLELFDEMIPLFVEHDRAVSLLSDIPLSPDYDAFLGAEAAGRLRIFTARDESTEELLGYSVFFVFHSLHRKQCLQAEQSALYVKPDRAGFGSRFIGWVDDQLESEGAGVIIRAVKRAFDYGPMLERKGYSQMETVYFKRAEVVHA